MPFVRWFWPTVAVACFAAALLLGEWLIPPLDAKQAAFRDSLAAGLRVVRAGLAVAALLAAVCALARWRAAPVETPTSPRFTGRDYLGAALVLAVGALLAAPRLGTSLWWDELGTVVTVVRRGPLVILTYSNNANNHVLNSLLLWASRPALGQSETALHLIPFLFFLATAQLVYWALLRPAGRDAALLAGLAAAAHPWLVNHGVEARGYAGAVLCCWAACALFAGLMVRWSAWRGVLYVAACVAAFGFVTTTILVPFAHGVLACGLLVREWSRPGRGAAANLVLACLWVPALALIAFGIPLPQTLAYARGNASLHHLPLGWAFAEQLLPYAAGLRPVVPALLALGVAAFGWGVALRRTSPPGLRRLALAALGPLVAAALYVAVPGTHASARFFCFALPAFALGVGAGLAALVRCPGLCRVAGGLLLAGWLALLAVEHEYLLRVNRPDLKGLAAELRGRRILLIGTQADVNAYYFPDAASWQKDDGPAALAEKLASADAVIEGRARVDNRLGEPDAAVAAAGFRIERALPTAVPSGSEFVVYGR